VDYVDYAYTIELQKATPDDDDDELRAVSVEPAVSKKPASTITRPTAQGLGLTRQCTTT